MNKSARSSKVQGNREQPWRNPVLLLLIGLVSLVSGQAALAGGMPYRIAHADTLGETVSGIA